MHDGPMGAGEAVNLFRVKRLFQKIDQFGRPLNAYVRRDGVIALRNWFNCHDGSLLCSMVNNAVRAQFIVSTTRKRALPLTMRSYAAAACSKGKVSTMGRMPVSAQKLSVSSESRAVPDGQP